MDAEEQIRRLKQIPPLTKEEKRKKLMTAIVLSLSTLISVLFLMYAFMQKIEADKNASLSKQLKIEADLQRAEAEKMKIEADHQRMEAEKQRQLAMEALAACEKSKKK